MCLFQSLYLHFFLKCMICVCFITLDELSKCQMLSHNLSFSSHSSISPILHKISLSYCGCQGKHKSQKLLDDFQAPKMSKFLSSGKKNQTNKHTHIHTPVLNLKGCVNKVKGSFGNGSLVLEDGYFPPYSRKVLQMVECLSGRKYIPSKLYFCYLDQSTVIHLLRDSWGTVPGHKH